MSRPPISAIIEEAFDARKRGVMGGVSAVAARHGVSHATLAAWMQAPPPPPSAAPVVPLPPATVSPVEPTPEASIPDVMPIEPLPKRRRYGRSRKSAVAIRRAGVASLAQTIAAIGVASLAQTIAARGFADVLDDCRKQYGLTYQDILGRSRSYSAKCARHHFWHSLRAVPLSLTEIGALVGCDHTSVRHGIQAHVERALKGLLFGRVSGAVASQPPTRRAETAIDSMARQIAELQAEIARLREIGRTDQSVETRSTGICEAAE